MRKTAERGYALIGTDIDPEALGAEHVEHFFNVSADDYPALLNIAQKYKPKAVYSSTDRNIAVAKIQEMLGLPHASMEFAVASEDKIKLRDLASKYDLPLTPGIVPRDFSDAVDFFDGAPNGVVVKVPNLSSSRGIYSAKTPADLRKFYDEAAAYESGLVIEQVVDGICLDLNGMMVGSSFYRMGAVQRAFATANNSFVQSSVISPPNIEDGIVERAFEMFEQVCRKLDVRNSPVKADVIYSMIDDQIYLLEVGPRFHGEIGLTRIIPLSLGIDPWEFYLSSIGEQEVDESKLVATHAPRFVELRASLYGTEKSNYDVNVYHLFVDEVFQEEIVIK